MIFSLPAEIQAVALVSSASREPAQTVASLLGKQPYKHVPKGATANDMKWGGGVRERVVEVWLMEPLNLAEF